MLHTYTSPVRPNPPPRAAASNFPPPPRRTPQASASTSFPPPPPSGSSRYTNHMRADPANAYKSPADDAKARANAFRAWEQMRHGQGVPPQARPVPPRPTKPAAFQPEREPMSYPPKEPTQRPMWDQGKEPHPGLPKMARSNTTRVPKKGGFAPGFSVGDEPSARNTSAYFNVSKGERPDISRTSFEPRPPPPPHPSNGRSNLNRPDPLKAFRPHSGVEDPSGNKERISTPYATSGGEKTYFTSTGFGKSATSRDGPTSGDAYDSEPFEQNSPHSRNASASAHRGHHSASPKLRSPRPVSVSSVSSSSSDESLREGVEQLYTAAENSHVSSGRTQNGHLRPAYKSFIQVDDAEGGKGLPPRSRSDATEKHFTSQQRPYTTGSNIDPGLSEGFMEHRMKHEAGRAQGLNDPAHSPPQPTDAANTQRRPLHRPKSWHEKYAPTDKSQANDGNGRPATGDHPVKPSMYDASGFGPHFFTPSSHSWCQQWPFGGLKASATASCPRVSPPYWAIPSSITPTPRRKTALEHQSAESKSQTLDANTLVDNADNDVCNSFAFPNNKNGQPVHPPPLRSHSSDTINVNFSPNDWHGKFTGKPEEYFGSPPKQPHPTHGRKSPTKHPVSPLKQAQPAPSGAGPGVPSEESDVPPPPPDPNQQESYSPDKWAPYFRPGTLNWPPPPPPAGTAARGAGRKRLKTPSRKGSRNVFKRPAVPKPSSVAAAVDDAGHDTTSSNQGSMSSQSSGNGSAMDLDTSTSPPSGEPRGTQGSHTTANIADTKSTTPRPPIPPRGTVPPQVHAPQEKDQLDLGNLQNIAPFAPNQQGIKDLNDLTTALPFESKASVRPPSDSPKPRKLEIPNPPKAPPAPLEKLTQSSWERYITAMRAYMHEWNAYNTKMLSHFNERQASVEATLRPEWMSAVGGAGSEQWGFGKYMQGVEEDFRVREHWDVSWERHRECMRTLGGVRERVLLGSANKSGA